MPDNNNLPQIIADALKKGDDLLLAKGLTVANVRATKMPEGGASDYVINVTFNDRSRIGQFSNERYAETFRRLLPGDKLSFLFRGQKTVHVGADKAASGVPYEYQEFDDVTLLTIEAGHEPEMPTNIKDRTPLEPQVSRRAAPSTIQARGAQHTDTEDGVQESAFAQQQNK